MRKSLIIIPVILCIVLSLLSGCGSQTQSAQKPTEAEPETDQDVAFQSTQKPTEAEPEINRDLAFQEELARELIGLGALQVIPNLESGLNKVPTKAEGLAVIVQLMGRRSEAISGTWSHPFKDAPEWADSYIGYAYENGLIEESSINFAQNDQGLCWFLTTLLKALGYSPSDFKAEDPYGPAKDLGLLNEGIDEAELCRADLLTIFASALEIVPKGSDKTIAAALMDNGIFTNAQYAEAELTHALALGLISDDVLLSWDNPITFSGFAEMLSAVIQHTKADVLANWEDVASNAFKETSAMERDDGILALYEAACVLGIGRIGTAYWNQINCYYNNEGITQEYSPREDIFPNCRQIGQMELNLGEKPDLDYYTCASFYQMGNSSSLCLKPFFNQCVDGISYNDSLTSGEAVRAVYRLYLAYLERQEGSFNNSLYATDWNDSLLAEAGHTLEEIISSSTEFKKSDELILGETYTGNEYYVSNGGNDANDGKSPSTAWASLDRVRDADLQYGDIVYFERGGTWYGELIMRGGVTYTAYGNGPKPVISGSVPDAAESASWTLYGMSVDGGKIWLYKDATPDCGLILLNGTIVARKAYPAWDGHQYIIDGEEFTLEDGLFADLMYFTKLDLDGRDLPLMIEGSGMTGELYFRCDAGNPAEVFDTIELALSPKAAQPGQDGWNAIDNINFRCYSISGMDCCNQNHIVYQNCETAWCGGAVKEYDPRPFGPATVVSGGGALMFACDVVYRHNYIHDCESKGLAVVSSGNPATLNRVGILAEGNVVERCGSAVYFWTGGFQLDAGFRFEDVTIRDNYFINSAYGWRAHSDMWVNGGIGAVGLDREAVTVAELWSTGDVRLENNLFYRAAGCLVRFEGNDFSAGSNLPIMSGNTYVLDKGDLMLSKRDNVSEYPFGQIGALVSNDSALMEKYLREGIEDKTGTVIVK